MAQKDLGEKLLEDYADVFADIVNVLIFHGKRLVREEDLSDGPTVSRYKDAQENLREQVRDVVKYDKRQTTLALFGLENQSGIDEDMVFRVMGYDYASYRKQMNSGKKKYPVFTLVLNFGMKRWDGPKDVLSALDPELPYAEYYEEAISNPVIHVVDVAWLPQSVREQFTSDFRIVAEYFSAVREKRERDIRYSEREIRHVEEILDFFRIFSRDKRFEACKPMVLKEAEKGAVNMCTVMDFAEREGIEKGKLEGREEGRKEGRKEGRIEGRREGKREGQTEQAMKTAREMLLDGEPDEKIRRYTGLTDEDIRRLRAEM